MRKIMTTTENEQQITQVIHRLDLIKIELIRLRATLLPDEELTPEEKRELEKSRRDVEEGRCTSLEDLLDELS
jgi:thiazole synthase ThiGH ThiG subunit